MPRQNDKSVTDHRCNTLVLTRDTLVLRCYTSANTRAQSHAVACSDVSPGQGRGPGAAVAAPASGVHISPSRVYSF